MSGRPTVAVLGASGLIGGALAEDLARRGAPLLALARRFAPSQAAALGAAAVVLPFVEAPAETLARVLAERGARIVVNCVGVLQDSPRGRIDAVHGAYVARLLEALKLQPEPVLLVHVSVPGAPRDDRTGFSRSKRAAEQLIAASSVVHVILRPGFVVAPAAYGGSALMRALAALPVRLPAPLAERPFRAAAIDDLCATVRHLAELAPAAWPHSGVAWDVMARERSTAGEVLDAFRRRFGGPQPVVGAPLGLLRLGAWAGDAVAWLGWSPPVRSTALAEMARGVDGDPAAWSAATGIEPTSLAGALAAAPASVQEAWFGRLYLAKPLVIGALAAFWIASGLIALGPAHAVAAAMLVKRGLAPGAAALVTTATALADVAAGMAIAVRRICAIGLASGITLALAYLAAASLVAPTLWIDPLGPLVKVVPIIVLMLAALAMLRER